ncbi:hypothetical protein [Mycolicibacter arupensis]|jgi:hypothetical protein|uniref:DUF2971 domain-containing protein n=1 Tax=Mycolicibacter arupensis TaxID=342002 RepID=A0A0F5MY26_9MYCO|nr:hypothetical protein [Mycolicibacter arupensis]KKB99611.1 hypothetical protein WR43_08910 [Mycolicibacter arupensis]MCV7274875.1 DUF2971 domain-containing protein [Mycolicibacter arupensis]OQZ93582.1 hypothetical protein BST15_17775 [Mycolicibacter arupensis]TXI51246.1 MAG: DUF2971 domain-containing protein [Mycolicibacter arupensis]
MSTTEDHAESGASTAGEQPIGGPYIEPSSPLPETVYHYTTAAGLLGIVNNDRKDDHVADRPRPLEFWASDLLDMNDATELAFGLELMHQRVTQDRPDSSPPDTSSRFNGVLSVLDQYLGVPELDQNRSIEPRPSVCGASFSTESDALSQWVRYGAGGGFAIGIKGCLLRDVPYAVVDPSGSGVEEFPCSFAEINYGEKARGIIDGLPFLTPGSTGLLAAAFGVAGLVSLAKAVWDGIQDPEHKLKLPIHPASPLIATATVAAAQCKDGAFSDEKEWRLLVGGNSERFADLLLNDAYPLKFRQKGDRLVPYRKVVVRHPEEGAVISELVVGPGPDQARVVHAAQRLLIANGHDPRVVHASKTPYRGW